jgi:hypothetical protein
VQRVRDWHEIARAAQDERGLVLRGEVDRGEVDRSEREGDEARVGPAEQSREKVVQVIARERGVTARRPIKRLKRHDVVCICFTSAEWGAIIIVWRREPRSAMSGSP